MFNILLFNKTNFFPSFGLRSYLKTVQPREFLLQSISSEIPFKGEDYILELAKYWYERLQIDTLTNKFGIKGHFNSNNLFLAK